MKLWGKHKGKPVKLPQPDEDKPPTGEGTHLAQGDLNLNKLTPEARAKLEAEAQKIREILNFAEKNPEDASMVLRAWLAQKDAK
ncbi:hypothetical protein ACFL6E_05650 [Candidatus Neomarinimicrobiota bacterium]